MDWLTQNWIWIVVIAATLFMLRRMSHHGLGGAGYHDYGTHDEAAGAGNVQTPGGNAPRAAIDPVSGNALKTDHAITSFYRDRVYFFESEETRRSFEAEPERFAASAAGVNPNLAEQRPRHRRHGC